MATQNTGNRIYVKLRKVTNDGTNRPLDDNNNLCVTTGLAQSVKDNNVGDANYIPPFVNLTLCPIPTTTTTTTSSTTTTTTLPPTSPYAEVFMYCYEPPGGQSGIYNSYGVMMTLPFRLQVDVIVDYTIYYDGGQLNNSSYIPAGQTYVDLGYLITNADPGGPIGIPEVLMSYSYPYDGTLVPSYDYGNVILKVPYTSFP